MKFESHWPEVQEELAFKANYSRFSIFSYGGHFVHWSRIVFGYFGRGSPKQHSYEV